MQKITVTVNSVVFFDSKYLFTSNTCLNYKYLYSLHNVKAATLDHDRNLPYYIFRGWSGCLGKCKRQVKQNLRVIFWYENVYKICTFLNKFKLISQKSCANFRM